MNRREETEILYEISLALGTSLNLQKMLREAVSTILRTLNCRGAQVLQVVRREEDPELIDWKPVCTLPRPFGQDASCIDFLNGAGLPATLGEWKNRGSAPPLQEEREGSVYLLFSLPEFGAFAFGLRGAPLGASLLQSLQVLMNKLARAALACLYEEELQRQIQAAQAASVAKSRFLANMSHELRTPLNGVIGIIDLLLDTPLNNDQRMLADVARSSGETLLSLINDVLDLSKIESGKFTIERTDFDLRALMEDVIPAFAFRAKEKGLQFNCTLDPDVPVWLQGDPLRLRQILINLIGNAIKFTSKGSVSVRVSRDEGGTPEGDAELVALRFSVADTGIGIPPKSVGWLFENFTQVDASTTRKFGGTGLGLSISRQLAQLMGGEIRVSSEEGKGSEFWFTMRFPVVPPVSESPAAKGDSEAFSGRHRPAGNSSADFRACHILLVEDNRVNRLVAERYLMKMGVAYSTAENGAEALDALARHTFDLVFMDVQMPVMDGFETTYRIRNGEASARARHIPIIAMTAHALAGDREKCIDAGMSDYITKPLRSRDIQNAIDRWLNGQGTHASPMTASPANAAHFSIHQTQP